MWARKKKYIITDNEGTEAEPSSEKAAAAAEAVTFANGIILLGPL